MKYCDEYVCLFVCPLAYLENYKATLRQILCACWLLWLILPLSHCDLRYVTCTSSFVDDIMFSHHDASILHIMCFPKRRQHNSLNYCIDSNQVLILLNNKDRLWRCWLGGSPQGIWPVKNWLVVCWHGYPSGARCRFAYGPADATTATHCLLLQYKNSSGDEIANVNFFTTTSHNTSKYNPLLNIPHDAGRAAASGCGLVY